LEDTIGHALGMQHVESVILEKYQCLVDSSKGHHCHALANQAFEAIVPINPLQKLVCCFPFWFDGRDPNSSNAPSK
jgi:hypothetical protein